MTETVDILLEKLYSSNDPVCMEAAVLIDALAKENRMLTIESEELIHGLKLMLDALMEINEVAVQRDEGRSKKTSSAFFKEILLRLNECGNIAKDAINLDTIKSLFNGYIYK